MKLKFAGFIRTRRSTLDENFDVPAIYFLILINLKCQVIVMLEETSRHQIN
jgi:hypothetical protein